jgi:transcriptional regulator with XRE-family HTH domain
MASIGKSFREARERKGVDLSRAAAQTHILLKHLEMMEHDDFSRMPAPMYAKGFIRMYAEYLGIDPVPLVQEYVEVHLGESSGRAETPSKRTAPVPEPADILLPETEEGQKPVRKKVKRERKPFKNPLVPLWKNLTGAVQPVLARIREGLLHLVPYLPGLILLALLALIVVLIGRCAAGRYDAPDEAAGGAALQSGALMQEPPVRYLEIPVVEEENQP